MLDIYVLEDDFQQQARLEKAIEGYCHETDTPYKLEVHGKPNQLLAAISGKGRQQVFFLDIEIKEETQKGLEVAKAIRKADSQAIIVFVTTHSEFMPLTFQYQVSALDFIDKNLNETIYTQKIFDTLDYAKANLSLRCEDVFVFENKMSRIELPYQEIYFIETSTASHKVTLHGKNDYIDFYGKITEIAEKTELVQCHRSYAINPHAVTRLDKKKGLVYFPNGESCSVSRSYLKTVTNLLAGDKVVEEG